METDVFLEQLVIYSTFVLFIIGIVIIYIRKQKRESKVVEAKIEKAIEDGIHEPVTLHPVIDINSCIKSGACVSACPEHDILGIVNGKATVINASHCIGHGACLRACPVQAITLCIGTEKRGVEIPHIEVTFETNVPGIYIAGEMGGMGLIKNAVEQGKQAVENLLKKFDKKHTAEYDLIVVGAGPAGFSATLAAKKHQLKTLTLEQDTLGGSIASFPRSKIIMTSPMEIPLHGKVKFYETNKLELLQLWNAILDKNKITIAENAKVEAIQPVHSIFEVTTQQGVKYTAHKVVLAIGRRGTPRKLNVPGEQLEKVAYRMIEPELIDKKNILVVGGGDSAVETAMLLADNNKVTLSYRGEGFQRIKPKNAERIKEFQSNQKLEIVFNSNVIVIEKDSVTLKIGSETNNRILDNDLVYILAGGELPTQFLDKIGIKSTIKHGEVLLRG